MYYTIILYCNRREGEDMKNWNSILRWIHLIFGFTLNLYLFQTVFLGNEVSNQLANYLSGSFQDHLRFGQV